MPLDPCPWGEVAPIVTTSADTGFGTAVALAGGDVLVGAPRANKGGGAVYVFERTTGGWMQKQELHGSGPGSFGAQLSASGDTVAVGYAAPATNGHWTVADSDGADVFVRREGTWVLEQHFATRAIFALSGDSLLIAHPDRVPVVEVLTRTDDVWTPTAQLQMPEANNFLLHEVEGDCAAISGDTAFFGLVGTRGLGVEESGRVNVLTRSGTTLTPQPYLARQGTSFYGLGCAISGDTALVRAYRPSPEIGTRPAKADVDVLVRSGDQWTSQATLSPSLGESEPFGAQLALSADGNTALISDNATDGDALVMGYVFARSGTTWTEQARLRGLTASSDLPSSVALDDTHLLVGAPQGGSGRGIVHVFEPRLLDGSSCEADAACSSLHCVSGACCHAICDGACSIDPCQSLPGAGGTPAGGAPATGEAGASGAGNASAEAGTPNTSDVSPEAGATNAGHVSAQAGTPSLGGQAPAEAASRTRRVSSGGCSTAAGQAGGGRAPLSALLLLVMAARRRQRVKLGEKRATRAEPG